MNMFFGDNAAIRQSLVLVGLYAFLNSSALAAPEPTTKGSAPADNTATAPTTSERMQKQGKLIIGYVSSFPFAFKDKSGNVMGYSIDICNHIAQSAKKKLNLQNLQTEYVEVKNAERIPFLEQGTLDMECGSSTNTVDRQKKVSFTYTTFYASVRVLAKPQLNITTYDKIHKKRVGVSAGSTGKDALASRSATLKISPIFVDVKTDSEGLSLLEDGQIDAYATDDILLYSVLRSAKNPSQWTVQGDPLTVEPYGMMYRKGDPTFEAIAEESMRTLILSGGVLKLYRKWFDTDELRVPVSKFLREAMKVPTNAPQPKTF
jgi:glutamate/aspartate transport system substrate-binding protein